MRYTSGRRYAVVGSAVTHGILIVILWGTLTLAAAPVRQPAEVAACFEAPIPLEAPIPEPRPELAPVEEDAPPPVVEDAPLPEEPDPFEMDEPEFDAPALLVPPKRPMAAVRRLPLPPRAAPPAPPVAPVAPVAVAVPTGPTRIAAPAPGNPAPRYPELAIERGIEGVVVLMVTVRPDGTVAKIGMKQSSGSALLDREAIRTVTTWKFLSALHLGRSVESSVEVPIRFRFD